MDSQKRDPILGAAVIFVFALTVNLLVTLRAEKYFIVNQIASPQTGASLPIFYFLGVAVLMGVILLVIPRNWLRLLLKALFLFLFSWGPFVILTFMLPTGTLPTIIAGGIAIIAGLVWLFRPTVWYHNLLLVLALVSAAAVFGFILSPWATMIAMLVISVYDVVAVRSGYMVWMAKRLSELETMPIFVIPKGITGWGLSMKSESFTRIFQEESSDRDFSLLGGGDIGFPLLLVVSVYFIHGLAAYAIVSVFALLGIIAAFLIQIFFLKGKPMPALPPISALSLFGFLIVVLTLPKSG